MAARVLCTLLLGTYLVGGYGEPVAWGADNAAIHGEDVTIDPGATAASAWGVGTTASGDYSTAFGVQGRASGEASTTFGYSSLAGGKDSMAFGSFTAALGDFSTTFGAGADALGEGSTAFGYDTQAGQLLYGTDKKVATIEVDTSDGVKFKIVNAQDGKTLKGGFASYEDAYNDSSLTKVGAQATAFGNGTKASGEASTAFGYKTTASGNYSTAFGVETVASGAVSTAFGAGAEALEVRSTAFGAYSLAGGPDSTAFGVLTKASGQESTAFGAGTKAIGQGSTAFGANTQAGQLLYGTTEVTIKSYTDTVSGETKYMIVDAQNGTMKKDGFTTYWSAYNNTALTKMGAQATAFGQGTRATGDASTAFGVETEASDSGATAWGGYDDGSDYVKGGTASGKASTAFGEKTTASGEASTAFGISSEAKAKNSLAALGGIVETAATNSAAIGQGAKVTVADTVALGSESVASREAGATDAYLKGSNTGNAWVSTHNAIAVGNDDTVTRQITGVAAGSKDTDAVNVAQLKTLGNKVAANEGRLKVTEDLLAGDWGGKTVKETIDAKADKATTLAGYGITDAYTKDETDTALAGKADKATTLAGYGITDAYTKGETDTALAGKADKATTLAGYGITDAYTKDETDTALAGKADKATTLAGYGITDAYTTTQADSAINAAVAGKADKATTLAGYGIIDAYTKPEADSKFASYDFLNQEELSFGANSTKISIGKGSSATGSQSIAIGFGNKVSGNNSGAFGDPNTVSGTGSYAVGNNNTIGGNDTFVLGNNVTADVDNAVVLGAGSKAEADAVSVGSDGGERQIKHVKDGTDDTDAATVGQLKALAGGTGAGLEEVTHRISNLDSKVNKVGAGAAALAALHPLDTDNKFTMAAGFGNYRNANAMALGMFYRPTDKVMFSVGGAMGNGENMINAGVSFALDKGVGTSKAAMARTIKAQGDRIAEQDAKIQSLEAYNAKLEERLAALEAKIGK